MYAPTCHIASKTLFLYSASAAAYCGGIYCCLCGASAGCHSNPILSLIDSTRMAEQMRDDSFNIHADIVSQANTFL